MSVPSLAELMSPHLGPLSPAAAQACGAARCLDLEAGQTLLGADEVWQHLWGVARGSLRLYHLDAAGQASNKNFFLAGGLLWPITPGLRSGPCGFWIEAVAPSRVWALPWPAWQAAAGADPQWQAFEQRSLSALLEHKMERERQFLHCSAGERYLDLLARHGDWVRELPLRHLASWLGITDVALSRIRRRHRLNRG